MHPNRLFQSDDRALAETLLDSIGFGTVFAATAEGPRVAHTPLLAVGGGRVRFHLSRGNALTGALAGQHALCVVNGPDGYVSPRWYSDSRQVPTWNYVALELEGPITMLDRDGLHDLLDRLSARHESRIVGGAPWTMDKTPTDLLERMLGAIVGFEMRVHTTRLTNKLSQNKPAGERARVADGLAAQGATALATLMREQAA